jgi:hypothetical protein
MIYKFDPKWFNGAIFSLDKASHMAKGWMGYEARNEPIPASYFPSSLTIERAKAPLPDLFHTSRGLFVVSERARLIFEKLAPGEIEFIPVEIKQAPTGPLNPLIDAYYSIKDLGRPVAAQLVRGQVDFLPVGLEPKPRITLRLNLASAYYFVNVLGRAQRLLWLQMETRKYQFQTDDGADVFGLLHDFSRWRLCKHNVAEPLIWQETDWREGRNEYRAHSHVFIEDVLWQELDANFPGQLHPLLAVRSESRREEDRPLLADFVAEVG